MRYLFLLSLFVLTACETASFDRYEEQRREIVAQNLRSGQQEDANKKRIISIYKAAAPNTILKCRIEGGQGLGMQNTWENLEPISYKIVDNEIKELNIAKEHAFSLSSIKFYTRFDREVPEIQFCPFKDSFEKQPLPDHCKRKPLELAENNTSTFSLNSTSLKIKNAVGACAY